MSWIHAGWKRRAADSGAPRSNMADLRCDLSVSAEETAAYSLKNEGRCLDAGSEAVEPVIEPIVPVSRFQSVDRFVQLV